jgi:hypothetical protein
MLLHPLMSVHANLNVDTANAIRVCLPGRAERRRGAVISVPVGPICSHRCEEAGLRRTLQADPQCQRVSGLCERPRTARERRRSRDHSAPSEGRKRGASESRRQYAAAGVRPRVADQVGDCRPASPCHCRCHRLHGDNAESTLLGDARGTLAQFLPGSANYGAGFISPRAASGRSTRGPRSPMGTLSD